MPVRRPESVGANLILRGSFNPAIFQPAWFQLQQILKPAEVEALQVDVIHRQFTSLQSESWKLTVTDERYSLSTEQERVFPEVRDITAAILRILSQTPLTVLGLNRWCHYRLDSEEQWHSLGYRLAPKEPWNPVFSGRHAGLRSLTIESERPDSYPGSVSVKVEPSKKHPYGLFVHVNDHFAFGDDARPAHQPRPRRRRYSGRIGRRGGRRRNRATRRLSMP